MDERLQHTPDGAPAHLLKMVPDAPRATQQGIVHRRQRR